jgi:uncharacterized protein YndB with AHSA1/START domain
MDAPHGFVPPVRPSLGRSARPRNDVLRRHEDGAFRGEVTDYQPPSRIGFRETLRWFGSDMTEARAEYFLEADRDSTIVHHVAEGDLFGLMRLMKPGAALLARSERPRTLESLRRSLESE